VNGLKTVSEMPVKTPNKSSGVALGWAGWAKSRDPECRGPKFQAI